MPAIFAAFFQSKVDVAQLLITPVDSNLRYQWCGWEISLQWYPKWGSLQQNCLEIYKSPHDNRKFCEPRGTIDANRDSSSDNFQGTALVILGTSG